MTPWQSFVTKWKDCQACPLCRQRFRICLARGAVPCSVLLVGEAPGASEDTIGVPFCGPAGHLLDQIVERAIPAGVPIAYCNLVCCYPAEAKAEGHNEPARDEILACRPRLIEFVNISRPRLIVCVGSLAADYVDHGDTVPCADITHPAAILRMPLAQKQMATQRCIVTLRNAVEDMMSKANSGFAEWGTKYISRKAQTGRERLRADYSRWVSSADDPTIPF